MIESIYVSVSLSCIVLYAFSEPRGSAFLVDLMEMQI